MSSPNTTPVEGQVVSSHYTSRPVPIPLDFLRMPLERPIAMTRLDFEKTALSEYGTAYAVVLDGVLSQVECDVMIALAEESSAGGWSPAMLRAGGLENEALRTDVRHSDRIIWDTPDLANRIFDRCLQAEGLHAQLLKIDGTPILRPRQVKAGEIWKLARPNERLRFLRYGVGHYFRSHVDGVFRTADEKQRSFYTLHLYLNTLPHEGMAGPPPAVLTAAPPSGGSTTFLPSSHRRDGPVNEGLWVAPRAGRVLIFQQKDLRHDGEEVKAGLKVTMRTDLMYELQSTEELQTNV